MSIQPPATMSVPDQKPVSFTEQLYTLSCINPVRDFIKLPHPELYRIGSNNNTYNHNLQLVDGIALLLSSAGKSGGVADAVAVTYELTNEGAKFFYSKNRPYNPAEKVYIERLLDIVKDTPTKEKCTAILLRCVIPECQEKIMSRIRKIGFEIRALKPLGSTEEIPVYSSVIFESFVRIRLMEMVPIGTPVGRFLVYYLTLLSEINNLDNIFQIIQSMYTVYLISTAPDIDIVLPYKELRMRLKKFGEYFMAAGTISWSTSENPRFTMFKEGLTFTEIAPPEPFSIPITDSLNNILSHVATTHYLTPLTTSYPIHSQLAHITTFIHPEVTLATFVISRRLASAKLHNAPISGTIEIGMNKSLCWLCKAYLHKLQGENLFTKVMEVGPTGKEKREVRSFHVVVSRYESKVKAEWRMPEDAEDEVREHVEDLVSREVVSLIETIQYKLKPTDTGTQSASVGRQIFGVDDI